MILIIMIKVIRQGYLIVVAYWNQFSLGGFVNKNKCISNTVAPEEDKSIYFFLFLIIHVIVSYDQNISLIFYVKDCSHVRLWHLSCVYFTAQRQYTPEIKICTPLKLSLHYNSLIMIILYYFNIIKFSVFEIWFIIIILIIADNPSIIRNRALGPVHLSSSGLTTVGSF